MYTDQWRHYEHLALPNAVGPLLVCEGLTHVINQPGLSDKPLSSKAR